MKEKEKIKGSVIVAESAYNSQNAQFDLVMIKPPTKSWFFPEPETQGMAISDLPLPFLYQFAFFTDQTYNLSP